MQGLNRGTSHPPCYPHLHHVPHPLLVLHPRW